MSVNCPFVAAQGYAVCCDLGTSSQMIGWNPQYLMEMIQIYSPVKTFHYFCCTFTDLMVSLLAQTVKNLLAMWENWVWSLGWEDPLEESKAMHSSILVCRIPMDRGAWWATVHGVAKSQTWLTKHTNIHTLYLFSKSPLQSWVLHTSLFQLLFCLQFIYIFLI